MDETKQMKELEKSVKENENQDGKTDDKNSVPQSETQNEKREIEKIHHPVEDAKKEVSLREVKRKKIKLKRNSAQSVEDDGVRVSVDREEEEMLFEDDEQPRKFIQSRSRADDRKVIKDSSVEGEHSSRKFIDRSERNIVQGKDYDKSKRKIVYDDYKMSEQDEYDEPRRNIYQEDSRHSHRKVYQEDEDTLRRKIFHDDSGPPRRKFLNADSDSSRRRVYQADRGPSRRMVVEDLEREPSQSLSYEDVRHTKLSRGGDLWKRGPIEERTREVEVRMEQQERQAIEETKEAEAKRLKEEELNARIQKIKRKNAAILQRYNEIEAEKIMFGS